MRRFKTKQRNIVLEMATSLEHMANELEKQATHLAREGTMPQFVRTLITTAQGALDEASTGLVDWANGEVDDRGRAPGDRTETLSLVVTEELLDDEDLSN